MSKKRKRPRPCDRLGRFVRIELDEDGGGEAYRLEGVALLKLEHLDPRPADQAMAERMLAKWAGYLGGRAGQRERARMVKRHGAGVADWWKLAENERAEPWHGGL